MKTVRGFLISQIGSILGSAVTDYVLIWYITMESGSGLLLSLSLLVTFLPRVLAAFVFERYASLFRLKSVLIGADLFAAALSAVLALFIYKGRDSYELLLGVMALRAAAAGIQSPCEKIFISQITPGDRLLEVNGYNSTIQSLCSLLAPALGGLFAARMSVAAALFLDPATVLAAVAVLLTLPDTGRAGEPERGTVQDKMAVSRLDWETERILRQYAGQPPVRPGGTLCGFVNRRI